MKPRVVVVDYGIGNLRSVRAAFEHCGAQVTLSDAAPVIAAAERLVIPGVGAFGHCMAELNARQLVPAVRDFAAAGRPWLGICVGMQMMLDASEEFGRNDGLGLLPGTVQAIPATGADGTPHKIPFVGWAPLRRPEGADWRGGVLADVTEGEAVYFVHSFSASPATSQHCLASYDYDGRAVTAALARDNLVGCQFHPEKSGPVGLRIISRFLAL